MKKTIIIIAVLMALDTASYASPISQQWIKTYHGQSSLEIIQCIQQTIDGGYIVAGDSRPSPGAVIDLLIMKLDVNGNMVWQHTYPFEGADANDAYSIQQTTDGGYIVAGAISSGIGTYGVIVKLDSNGAIQWQKSCNEVVQFRVIQQTTDGGYVAAGNDPNDGILLLKLDSTGNSTRSMIYNGFHEASAVIQISNEGYIVAGHTHAGGYDYYDIWVLKVDLNGNILWQKRYDGGGSNNNPSIQQTGDEGFIVLANGVSSHADLWVLKLDSSGSVIWQKSYGGVTYDFGNDIQQTSDGGYIVTGSTKSFGAGDYDVWLLKLDSSGNIVWEKTYGGPIEEFGIYYGMTSDGGGIIVGNTYSYETGDGPLITLKLDGNGEIPDCDVIGTSRATVSSADMTMQDAAATAESLQATLVDTNAVAQDISVETCVVCYYEDPNDIDGDGVTTSSGGFMASSIYGGSFLADGDNCSDMPNGPYLGTCTEGKVGSTCIADAACGVNGFCSMNQEDTLPPQGNDIGDACECEGDFACDGDVDGSDASAFKTDFGRSFIEHPCIAGDACNGDFNCDGDVDGTDASLFKSDFGRSSMQNPCPACVQGEWCGYGEPFISGYWNSGCLGSLMEFAGGTCGEDEIVAEVTGNVIHLTHDNAFYNCCPDDISVTMTVEGNVLRVRETEVNVGCRCMCCYTVESEIADLEPGEYTIEYCWKVVGGPCETLTVNVAQ